MKIALLNVVGREDLDQLMPVGPGYLKSYVEQHRNCYDIEIIDDPQLLWECSYDIAGLSCVSQNFGAAINIADTVKRKTGVPVVIGGFHISLLPYTLAPSMDIGVIGEGEQTFLELLDAFNKTGTLEEADLERIPGIVFRRKGGELSLTTPRQPFKTLDILPFPDRETTKKSWQSIYLFTSRGCPYRCIFCSSSKFWGHARFFSADYVIDELAHIINKFPESRIISFSDDLFIADRKRFRKIVEEIHRKGWATERSFICNVRADYIDDEFCELLKKGGIRQVSFGLESANQRVLTELKCSTLTVDRCREAVDTLHRHGIVVHTTYIVGSPGETEAEARETFDFIYEHIAEGKIAEALCNIMCPLPGTKLWDAALSAGIVSHDMEWSKLSHYTWTGGGNYNLLSLDEWLEMREKNNGIYLNRAMDKETLYDLMREYEQKILAAKLDNLYEEYKDRMVPWVKEIKAVRNIYSVVCYGACDFGRVVMKILMDEGIEILGVADGDLKKQGRDFLGHKVIQMNVIPTLHPDAVIVCSIRREYEIYNQIKKLEKAGIPVIMIFK